jgi:hypothetical protein
LYAKGNPGGAGLSALPVVALFQMFNLSTVFFLFNIILDIKIPVSKLLIVAGCALLLVLNGIRYNKLTYAILKERWDNEEENKKVKKQLLLLLYIVGSAALFVGLALSLGGQNR